MSTGATGSRANVGPGAGVGPTSPGVLERLEAGLGRPFVRTTPAEAVELLRGLYGVDGVDGVDAEAITRLDTERDDTFRVTDGDRQFVLKIAHPDDDPAELDLQEAAQRHAAATDPGLPLQPIVEALHQPITATGRRVRLLGYLPGDLLQGARATDAQVRECGRMLARLGRALSGFEHPASGRWLAWDLQHLDEFGPLLPYLDASRRAAVAAVLDRLAATTLPALRGTRAQVVHNDFHGENVLVGGAVGSGGTGQGFVTGILDFGDVVHSHVVADLAVAASYAGGYWNADARTTDDPWAPAQLLREGYESLTPLDDAERALLPDLVLGRLVQRMLLGSWLASVRPENAEYTGRGVDATWEQFEALRVTLPAPERGRA